MSAPARTSVGLHEEPRRLPLPGASWAEAEAWVTMQLGDLCDDVPRASLGFRGDESAAREALASFDVRGYASRRNQVWPRSARGASALPPYIRHGLLPLPEVWEHVAGGPPRDVAKFRDELLWQEYARHLHAQGGARTGAALRAQWPGGGPFPRDPWSDDMRCLTRVIDELEDFGWIPNQTRMWLASHWAVRHGADWEAGEDRLYRTLLDGSRAANRLGWQWTAGTATGRPYAFTRWQVEQRAPGLCQRCERADACPIEKRPEPVAMTPRPAPAALRRDADLAATSGPPSVFTRSAPERVWLTAESLGLAGSTWLSTMGAGLFFAPG